MVDKNYHGFHGGDAPSAPPPPYSTVPPPGYPIGIVAPNSMVAPGQAQQHQQQHQQQQAQRQQQQQQQQNGQTPVIIYANSNSFGPYPMRVVCSHCNATIMTQTRTKPGLLTYILSGTLCVLGWYLFCCLVPCCIAECQDVEHLCPSCKSKLGCYKRI